MKSVHVETSIISYLTARPSRDLRAAAWQQITARASSGGNRRCIEMRFSPNSGKFATPMLRVITIISVKSSPTSRSNRRGPCPGWSTGDARANRAGARWTDDGAARTRFATPSVPVRCDLRPHQQERRLPPTDPHPQHHHPPPSAPTYRCNPAARTPTTTPPTHRPLSHQLNRRRLYPTGS